MAAEEGGRWAEDGKGTRCDIIPKPALQRKQSQISNSYRFFENSNLLLTTYAVMSTFCFVSEEPKAGDPPSRRWEDFKNPKLQRFPGSSDNFQWKGYLGGGTDGFVFEVDVDEQRSVAVKIVSFHSRFVGLLAALYWHLFSY